MVNRAVIVKDEYIVYASSNKLVPDNDEFTYSAALAAFVRARKQDIIHGVMFTDDAISLNGAQAVADAELSKVVYAKPAQTLDQVAALQLLEQLGIETKYNPNINL